MKVLIIDDNATDALFLQDVIVGVAPQAKCNISLSFIAAKDILDDGPAPDYIFLDAMMYPMGGKETLVLLTQMDKLDKTTIIINSGFISKSRVDEFTLLGADVILQKGADHRSFMLAVSGILSS